MAAVFSVREFLWRFSFRALEQKILVSKLLLVNALRESDCRLIQVSVLSASRWLCRERITGFQPVCEGAVFIQNFHY